MELNKSACEAAVGAFMDRITDKPTTGDMLAALRFALEAYESVRAPSEQAAIEEFNRIATAAGWIDVHRDRDCSSSLFELRDWFLSGVDWTLSSRAQRTDNPS